MSTPRLKSKTRFFVMTAFLAVVLGAMMSGVGQADHDDDDGFKKFRGRGSGSHSHYSPQRFGGFRGAVLPGPVCHNSVSLTYRAPLSVGYQPVANYGQQYSQFGQQPGLPYGQPQGLGPQSRLAHSTARVVRAADHLVYALQQEVGGNDQGILPLAQAFAANARQLDQALSHNGPQAEINQAVAYFSESYKQLYIQLPAIHHSPLRHSSDAATELHQEIAEHTAALHNW